ncbi:hypothetical protein ACIPWL_28310 [Streptomyces sp. NPDC090023]|uniref:hypothetical protein n=1 Tax=unclassified Streptomyces TaxID=2593676 RepID=UPI0038162C3E
MANRADSYGNNVEIFSWADGLVWADCRTGLPDAAHRVLRSYGFSAPADPGDPASYSLAADVAGPDRQAASSSAASTLADMGYRVVIGPSLVAGHVSRTVDSDAQRVAAARQVSTVATRASINTPPPAAPSPPAPGPVTRSR